MKTILNNVVLPRLFNVVNNIVQHCYTWLRANSGLTMLINIVNNIEQCGEHNIVQGCFHQPWTSCAFLAGYSWEKICYFKTNLKTITKWCISVSTLQFIVFYSSRKVHLFRYQQMHFISSLHQLCVSRARFTTPLCCESGWGQPQLDWCLYMLCLSVQMILNCTSCYQAHIMNWHDCVLI